MRLGLCLGLGLRFAFGVWLRLWLTVCVWGYAQALAYGLRLGFGLGLGLRFAFGVMLRLGLTVCVWGLAYGLRLGFGLCLGLWFGLGPIGSYPRSSPPPPPPPLTPPVLEHYTLERLYCLCEG